MNNSETELEPTPVVGEMQSVHAAVPAGAQSPKKFPALWRNRDYMLLWSGQVVSVVGTGASQIVYPLLILALTNSPAAAGVAAALASVPYIIFSLPAGALIDRWDRKRVMIYCDIGRALTLASIPIALVFHALTIWQIYVCALLEGSLFVFFNIAEVAALSRVVEKGQLPQAISQNEVAFTAANLISPTIGTTLFQLVGQAFPFVFDSVSYIASVISLLFIRVSFQSDRIKKETHLRAEIQEGLSWLWRQPLIRYMAFCTGALNFVNAPVTLIVIILAKNLGATDAEIGVVFSISAFGGIVGSLIGGVIQKRFRFGQVIITTVWITALLFPVFAFAPHFYILGIILGLTWITGPVYNVVQFSYRVALIPDVLQGRVNSVFRLLAFGFQPAGAAISGVLIERFGVYAAIAFFSVWYIGLAILTMLNPDVRNARQIGQSANA